MASTSSQTRSSATTTVLPTSLSEAQGLLAGIKSKSTLPSFFESPKYQKLLDGEYIPPILSSQSSPDYDGSSPLLTFLYPRGGFPFSFGRSSIMDHRSANKTPCKEDLSDAPKASSSKKKVEKPLPKPKATARSKTTVKVVEESRVSPESEESATPSYQIKRVRLPPRLCQAAKGKARQMEVLEVEESETEEEVVPPPSKRLKSSKSAPTSSKASKFRPALLINDQGRLKLPGDSVEGFTPFKQIEHARNSAPLHRQNPIFKVNPEFLDLGAILTTQKASFTMQDLLQINHTIRDPAIPAQACVSALS
ncbi:uncharacterized protein C8R40DRAFT_1175845 [Lentinula edodes]|uniref:uncharacterized protein n=1 Tax=Lentinula edodes TaxID=5353 RepID=UPI001E8E09B1|nr:uncharacterized protein C8R40DRAFT_1175845 [Lentinula edodes]KAH7870144.1 hypothetical protein C8R40DRAFT_1175845 [Lentinula edodes]